MGGEGYAPMHFPKVLQVPSVGWMQTHISESTLGSSSVCVVRGDVVGPTKASGEELPANAQAAEDDVKVDVFSYYVCHAG